MGDSVAADSWVWGFLGVNPALFAGAGPATVTRREAEAALASYLARAQAAQGGTALRLTPKVRAAIAGMAKNDQQLSLAIEAGLGGPDTAGDSAHVAAAIAKLLPETLPKESIAHLATAAVDEAKQAPEDIAGKLKEAAKEKLDLARSPDLEQDGRGSPYHNELPPASPPDPNAPTILHIPEQNWDWPKGKKAPRPAPRTCLWLPIPPSFRLRSAPSTMRPSCPPRCAASRRVATIPKRARWLGSWRTQWMRRGLPSRSAPISH